MRRSLSLAVLAVALCCAPAGAKDGTSCARAGTSASCASAPAAAEGSLGAQVWLLTTHQSKASLVDGKASYEEAAFDSINLQVGDPFVTGTSSFAGTTGAMTIHGGSYGYNGTVVDGEDRTFELRPDGDDLAFDLYWEGRKVEMFDGAAETGLPGARVSWTFPDGSGLSSGTATIPSVRTTPQQLVDRVPYVELIRNGSNVTGAVIRVVHPSATSTALTMPVPVMMMCDGYDSSGDELWWDDKDLDANEPLTWTVTFDRPILEASVGSVKVNFVPGLSGSGITSDVIVYRWDFDVKEEQPIDTITITFDAQGGTVSPSTMQTGPDGKLTSLPTPVRSGHTFKGWYIDPTGGTRITTDFVFSFDATVYAQWEESGPDEGSSVKEDDIVSGGKGGSTVTVTVSFDGHGVFWLRKVGGPSSSVAAAGDYGPYSCRADSHVMKIDVDDLRLYPSGKKDEIPEGKWKICCRSGADLSSPTEADWATATAVVDLAATKKGGGSGSSGGGCSSMGLGGLAMMACAAMILRRRS